MIGVRAVRLRRPARTADQRGRARSTIAFVVVSDGRVAAIASTIRRVGAARARRNALLLSEIRNVAVRFAAVVA